MQKYTIPIPDLRFENTFRKQLAAYAKTSNTGKVSKRDETAAPLPITPGIVLYAILKDQIVMQFVQGFGMAVVFMVLTPFFKSVMGSGFRAGSYVRNRVVSLGYALGI